MPSVIKQAAAAALGAVIEAGVPALAGKVRVGQAPPQTLQDYPCLVVVPRRVRPEFFQEYAVDETVDGVLVTSVGEAHGTFELWLATQYEAERALYEDLLNHLFYKQYNRPGVIVVNLPACFVGGVVTTYTASAAFELGEEEWQDELVFENARWRFMQLGTAWPLLVRWASPDRQGIYPPWKQIDHLVLGITNDLASDVASETVKVLQDGTLSKDPPL